MAYVSSIVTTDVPSGSAYGYCHVFFQLKQFLKAHGWTVKGSSDGTSWSMAGVDYFDAPSKIQATATNKWVVLVSPHAVAGDRVELLMYSHTTNTIGVIGFGPNGTLSASSTALPTGYLATAGTFIDGWTDAVARRLHMVLDDANDFEFALVGSKPLDANVGSELIVFQRLAVTPPDATTRYALFGQSCFISENQSGENTARLGGADMISGSNSMNGNRRAAWGSFSPTTGSPVNAGVAQLTKISSGISYLNVVPWGAAPGAASEKTSFPFVFWTMESPSKFLGIGSDFFRWNGQVSALLDSWGPAAGAYDRLALRTVNLAWDGVTAPVA